MKTNLLIAVIGFAAITALATKPQTKSWVNKDARFFVQHYEETDHTTHHVREDFLSGLFWMEDDTQDSLLNWDDGKGGKQTWKIDGTGDDSYNGPSAGSRNTLNTWPATWYPNLVNGTYWDSAGIDDDGGAHPPYIVLQHRDQKTKQNYSFASMGGYGYPFDWFEGPYLEEGHLTGAPHAQVVIKFYAGGMGLPKRKSVYQGSVSAVAHKQTGVIGIYNTPTYDNTPIASQNITLGDLGPLDPDGILYAKIDDGSTKDITPTVANTPYYTFGWPVLTKYTLISQVSCQALTDTNLDRTSLGVAEVVSLGTMPAETTWSTSAGTLSGSSGSGTYLYAPHTAATATVTATIRKVSLTIDFGVVEPSGVQSSVRAFQTDFASGSVGAGMYLNVVLQPTTVSFGNVEMTEPAEATTGITGYFTNHTPPTHAGNGAGDWHRAQCNNLVVDNFFDHAWSGGWQSPFGQGGSYTWPIHPIWRVVGDSATHPLSGWTDQVMTLSADGTMRVDKLGHYVWHPIW
jgi:hypothetical protein